MKLLPALTVVVLCTLAQLARADSADASENSGVVPPSAPAAAVGAEEDMLEPEVTITTERDEIHEEYRIHGRLYMIKIIPAKGPPYYLIDYDGTGEFRRSNLEPTISPPLWVLKEF